MNRRKTIIWLAVCAAGAFACQSTSDTDDESGEADITDIPNTSVLDQGQTGNCWAYATAAWAESLRASATGDTATHFSPSYWNYWDWYRQILGGSTRLAFGGYWGAAVEAARRYGLMPMGQFVANEAQAPVDALASINAALTTGSLKSTRARSDGALVRRALDEAFGLAPSVRELLTAAFGSDGSRTFAAGAVATGAILHPKDLKVRTPVFGHEPVDTTFDQIIGTQEAGAPVWGARVGPLAWKGVSPPAATAANTTGVPGTFSAAGKADYVVRAGDTLSSIAKRFGATVGELTKLNGLRDANRINVGLHLLIPTRKKDDAPPPGPPRPPYPPPDPTPPDPTPDPSPDADAPPEPVDPIPEPERPAPPASWRAFTQRIQRALNDNAPLPIAWYVSFDNASGSRFKKTSAAALTKGRTGWHESLITDYDALGVPGFGRLKAGAVANDAQKQAALADVAMVSFFRIKNSWGTAALPNGAIFSSLAGYNDLDDDYLRQAAHVCDDGRADTESCPLTGPFIQEVVLPPGY